MVVFIEGFTREDINLCHNELSNIGPIDTLKPVGSRENNCDHLGGTSFIEMMPFVSPTKDMFVEDQFGIVVKAWELSRDVIKQAFKRKAMYLNNLLPVCIDIVNNGPVEIDLNKGYIVEGQLPFEMIRRLYDDSSLLTSTAFAGMVGLGLFTVSALLLKGNVEKIFQDISIEESSLKTTIEQYADHFIFYGSILSVLCPAILTYFFLWREGLGIDRIRDLFRLGGRLLPGEDRRIVYFLEMSKITDRTFSLNLDNNLGKTLVYTIKL